jgi:hypothetical protein
MATDAVASPWWRYLRISVRGLIVLVLVLGGALGWIVNRAEVQRNAVAAIERAGGSVKYEWEWKDGRPNPSRTPRWPRWLVDYIGPNYLAHIAEAELARGGSDDQVLPVGKLKSLETLLNNTAVSDAGLERLHDNSSLHTLVLSGTKVTDAGVLRLQRALPELKIVR